MHTDTGASILASNYETFLWRHDLMLCTECFDCWNSNFPQIRPVSSGNMSEYNYSTRIQQIKFSAVCMVVTFKAATMNCNDAVTRPNWHSSQVSHSALLNAMQPSGQSIYGVSLEAKPSEGVGEKKQKWRRYPSQVNKQSDMGVWGGGKGHTERLRWAES